LEAGLDVDPVKVRVIIILFDLAFYIREHAFQSLSFDSVHFLSGDGVKKAQYHGDGKGEPNEILAMGN
jgi:hypothetical protein